MEYKMDRWKEEEKVWEREEAIKLKAEEDVRERESERNEPTMR